MRIRFSFKPSEKVIHFARNPIRGGNPARLATINITESFFVGVKRFSRVAAFVLEINWRMNKTETQYKAKNKKKILVLTIIARIIQPRLKIEDHAMISFSSFLLNMETAPKMLEDTIKKQASAFICSITRYKGAIFCQVNKIKFVLHFVLLATWMNHKWSGAAAAFTIKAMKEAIEKRRGLTSCFGKIAVATSIPEAIDCTMKYFIVLSLLL